MKTGLKQKILNIAESCSQKKCIHSWTSMQCVSFPRLQEVEDEDDNKSTISDVTTLEPKEPALFDDVNEIATMIESLSVQACELSEEFGNAVVALNDASNTIRAIFRNMENVCRAGKMKNAKQTSIRAFFTTK